MMEATKTIRCKLIGLTLRKRELLDREYDSFQHWLETGEDKGVYSAYKQDVKWLYKKTKRMKGVPIRKDLIDIQRRDNKIAKYWALPNLSHLSDASFSEERRSRREN